MDIEIQTFVENEMRIETEEILRVKGGENEFRRRGLNVQPPLSLPDSVIAYGLWEDHPRAKELCTVKDTFRDSLGEQQSLG